MAQQELTRPPAPASLRTWLRVRYRLSPWWLRVIAIFVSSHVVTTIILLAYAAAQQKNPWTGASPGYFDFAKIWDGTWYEIVAGFGYPAILPMSGGHVAQNAWAFLPGYPFLTRFLMLLSGAPFSIVAVVVSVAFALGAALVFHRIMVRVLPAGSALFAVVLFCTAPLSPILQVSYAESMYLFFLLLALLLLLERRYVVMIPVILVMALTRPSGLAFALLLLAHLVQRFVTRRRDPLPRFEVISIVGVGLFSALAGVLWPIIAWIGTGQANAYTETELAWRSVYIGYQELVPFQPWFLGADWWLKFVGVPAGQSMVIGAVMIVGVVGLFGVFLFTPWAKRLGPELRLWIGSYAVYLLAVFFPQSSTFRLLMPFAPALGALAVPRSPTFRALLVVGGILGQIGWIYIAWWVNGYDWSPP